MSEFLLELFSEEIPARMQAKAAADLKKLVEDGLKKAGLDFAKSEAFVTPRRLTLVIDGLPDKQPDIKDERKGPATSAPEQALNGFLGSLGGLSLDDCEQREIKGKTFYFAVIEKKGDATAKVLPGILEAALNALPWPKSMKWGMNDKRWVRPLHSIVAVFDKAVVPVTFGPVESSNTTHGHRFHAPDEIKVTDFADYRAKMAAAKIMLCPSERRAEIVSGAENLAEAAGLTVKPDEGLLREVTGLIEWPVVLMGSIDAAFMELPHEVLTTTMKTNQKYFSLLNPDGSLAPKFIVVSNMEATDGGAAIVAGNEKVLRARLADAQFFWDQDRKVTLASHAPKLNDIVFHAKLGTVAEKVDRMQSLACDIAEFIPGTDIDHVRSAASLSKCDLVTGMVYEFPEVQGAMGCYYALNDGEPADVAEAIKEHYAPAGPSDDCPTAPVSVAVAMADKIDTLVGFWTIDEKPTGSKDPFALRRSALGVIRLVMENDLRVPLLDVFAKAGGKDISDDLLSFFADRLKVHLKEQGIRHDLIDAVTGLGGEDDFVRLLARVDALSAFVGSDDGANLLAAHKRAANILRIEEKKDKSSYKGEIDKNLFQQNEESVLFEVLQKVAGQSRKALQYENYEDAMMALATLRAPVDSFFDGVMVNDDDPAVRINRLNMLAGIQAAMGEIADFSKIEG